MARRAAASACRRVDPCKSRLGLALLNPGGPSYGRDPPPLHRRPLLAAAAVLAGASLACFLTFHVLRPDMFAGPGSFAHQPGDFLDRTFLHGELGRPVPI